MAAGKQSPSNSWCTLFSPGAPPGARLDSSGEVASVQEVARLVRQAALAREDCRRAMDAIAVDFERDFKPTNDMRGPASSMLVKSVKVSQQLMAV